MLRKINQTLGTMGSTIRIIKKQIKELSKVLENNNLKKMTVTLLLAKLVLRIQAIKMDRILKIMNVKINLRLTRMAMMAADLMMKVEKKNKSRNKVKRNISLIKVKMINLKIPTMFTIIKIIRKSQVKESKKNHPKISKTGTTSKTSARFSWTESTCEI